MPKYEIDINVEPSAVMQALAECERESGARRGIYKNWVAKGQITQSLAAERQHRIDLAARILKQVVTSMHQPYQQGLDFEAGAAKPEAAREVELQAYCATCKSMFDEPGSRRHVCGNTMKHVDPESKACGMYRRKGV